MSLEAFETAVAEIVITRDNVDRLLDAGRIEAAMRNGRWWKARRNGATKRWKTDPLRVRIPIKVGFYASGCGAITEANFSADGVLDPTLFRYAIG